mmetsp:Transcript_5332/g.15278  ORF Transcript_5332/g.15278 Transcript_5332/m.15278 type:complete len:1146 (+) Transcript_5332:734-4171(+)|eukprot:CAMPEP_0206150856 /NCGR_PEP_ID=MMETSP1473-20131121/38521_1 /ASSEMBLY_ACC=CAM_ASM_001109 /TAXON_ID=1461547 /ORGANISM="Stichococcus sp, Strain RCC1054" /LENGTH=1145 /DNA_ID=CAMNT_0053548385 /DNA_START=669 /DNA_END=4106 /DNA_ORIENTATION=-
MTIRKRGPKQLTKDGGTCSGFIFGCHQNAEVESLTHLVFGMPHVMRFQIPSIVKDQLVFLFNLDTRVLHGVFKAECKGTFNLVPSAFRSGITDPVKKKHSVSPLPIQVRVGWVRKCPVLQEGDIRHVLKPNYLDATKFDARLSQSQVEQLLGLFHAASLRDLASTAETSSIKPRQSQAPKRLVWTLAASQQQLKRSSDRRRSTPDPDKPAQQQQRQQKQQHKQKQKQKQKRSSERKGLQPRSCSPEMRLPPGFGLKVTFTAPPSSAAVLPSVGDLQAQPPLPADIPAHQRSCHPPRPSSWHEESNPFPLPFLPAEDRKLAELEPGECEPPPKRHRSDASEHPTSHSPHDGHLTSRQGSVQWPLPLGFKQSYGPWSGASLAQNTSHQNMDTADYPTGCPHPSHHRSLLPSAASALPNNVFHQDAPVSGDSPEQYDHQTGYPNAPPHGSGSVHGVLPPGTQVHHRPVAHRRRSPSPTSLDCPPALNAPEFPPHGTYHEGSVYPNLHRDHKHHHHRAHLPTFSHRRPAPRSPSHEYDRRQDIPTGPYLPIRDGHLSHWDAASPQRHHRHHHRDSPSRYDAPFRQHHRASDSTSGSHRDHLAHWEEPFDWQELSGRRGWPHGGPASPDRDPWASILQQPGTQLSRESRLAHPLDLSEWGGHITDGLVARQSSGRPTGGSKSPVAGRQNDRVQGTSVTRHDALVKSQEQQRLSGDKRTRQQQKQQQRQTDQQHKVKEPQQQRQQEKGRRERQPIVFQHSSLVAASRPSVSDPLNMSLDAYARRTKPSELPNRVEPVSEAATPGRMHSKQPGSAPTTATQQQPSGQPRHFAGPTVAAAAPATHQPKSKPVGTAGSAERSAKGRKQRPSATGAIGQPHTSSSRQRPSVPFVQGTTRASRDSHSMGFQAARADQVKSGSGQPRTDDHLHDTRFNTRPADQAASAPAIDLHAATALMDAPPFAPQSPGTKETHTVVSEHSSGPKKPKSLDACVDAPLLTAEHASADPSRWASLQGTLQTWRQEVPPAPLPASGDEERVALPAFGDRVSKAVASAVAKEPSGASASLAPRPQPAVVQLGTSSDVQPIASHHTPAQQPLHCRDSAGPFTREAQPISEAAPGAAHRADAGVEPGRKDSTVGGSKVGASSFLGDFVAL